MSSLSRVSQAARHASRISASGSCLVSALRTSYYGVEATATSVRVCLASRVGAALISRGGVFGQVTVPHA